MFKRDVTYEDFDGEQVTETFYFNLSKRELIELEVEYKEGLQDALQRIIKANDNKTLISEFQKIVLLAYGIKSDDGRRFIKTATVKEEFSQTAAYDSLFMELATDAEAASAFINGIIPKDIAQASANAEAEKSTNTALPVVIPQAVKE
jgi:transcriptional regulator NrdR family protein